MPVGDVLLADAPGRRDRAAHLLDVPDAALAEAQVLLEERGLFGGQGALEVGGDELDHLVAADVVGRLSHRSGARAPCAPATAPGAAARERRCRAARGWRTP